VITLIGVIVLVAAAFTAAHFTEGNKFCGSACHEMEPYYATWQHSGHKNVPCVRCHIKPGAVELVKAKVLAMREVASHFTRDDQAPIDVTREVPNSTCVSCHAPGKGKDPLQLAGVAPVSFSHMTHTGVLCRDCHSQVVHNGTPGHPYVDPTSMAFCQRCHDGKKATDRCEACHTAPHETRGRCIDCHTQTSWASTFTHSVALGTRHAKVICENCHTQAKDAVMGFPAGCIDCHKDHHNDPKATQCAKCHRPTAFLPTTFKHPTSNCQSCHTPPHSDRGVCTRCHDQKSWASHFKHPYALAGRHASLACERCHTSGFNQAGLGCSSCHTPPHPARGTCTRCHTQTSFALSIRHPVALAGPHASFACERCHTSGFSSAGKWCASCHKPPHAYRGQCANCHKMTTWVPNIRHPFTLAGVHRSFPCERCHTRGLSSPGLSCVSCHGAHHGGLTTCSRCHRMIAWKPATFHHPATGMDGWSSMACTACHPNNSFAKVYCTCHGGNVPSGD
jgi:nitrate/TMAO reductase-like tetraheme cytochrome c subunit